MYLKTFRKKIDGKKRRTEQKSYERKSYERNDKNLFCVFHRSPAGAQISEYATETRQ